MSLKSYIFSLLLFIQLLMPETALSAHLVGGDLTYTCQGNNLYEVRLRIYRDCAGGGAGFDNIVNIAVYDVTLNLLRQISIPIRTTANIPTDSVGGNPCVMAPPGLCTQYADYIDTVSLPAVNGGYTLSWQRCCRNAAIQNIPTPDDYGNTYTVQIPSNDVSCNNSPQFNGIPPIVLCNNESLNLAMDVTEKDGDSLFFEFCDIFAGGSATGQSINCNTTAITPNPACPPPYNTIPFLPPFSSSNPIPAAPALTIDQQSGIITGRPNQLGRFVLGICVSEFRNGQLLSKVRLDYQFITTNCIPTVVSDMLTPDEDTTMLCDGLTVQFESQSIESNQVWWDFGVSGTSSDTSRSQKPSFTFPNPGTYRVTLVAGTGSPCSDTTKFNFVIQVPVEPQFRYEGQTCFDAQSVNFNAGGAYPAGSSFTWNFGADANISTFLGRTPPTIMWGSPGWHEVSLTVEYGACSHTVVDSVHISYLTQTIDAGPDQTVVAGQQVFLKASPGVDFYWYSDNAGIELSSRITQETILQTYIPDTIKMYVRVIDQYGCRGVDSLLIFVQKKDVAGPINFISPDGNGLNEMLDLREINPGENCNIRIINRWGSEVWRKNLYKNDWTGIDEGGNPLPDGTYYYLLDCEGEILYRGPVSLIRNP